MSMHQQQFLKVALGESFELQYGAPMPERERTGNGYPVFGSNGVVGRHSKFLIPGPGIVVGRKGSVGEVCWSNESFWPIDTAYYVVPKDGVNLRWLYWLLTNANLRRLDAATGVPGLNRNDVYDLKAHKPPIPDQPRIAAVLDTVDEAIAKTEAVIAKLRQVRAGLLHDLLTRGLDANGQLRDPVAHPELFQDSPLGPIPLDWSVGNVSDLAVNRDASRIPLKQADRDLRHGIYPYYGASGVIDFVDDYLFDGTFVLIGEDGENLRSRQLPLAFIATGKFWVNNHAHILEPLPDTDVRFLATILEAQDYVPWLLGSAQPKLTQRNFGFVPLRIPPAPEQELISNMLETASSEIDAEQRELEKLRQLKSGLMTDLLSGRVRVPETLRRTL